MKLRLDSNEHRFIDDKIPAALATIWIHTLHLAELRLELAVMNPICESAQVASPLSRVSVPNKGPVWPVCGDLHSRFLKPVHLAQASLRPSSPNRNNISLHERLITALNLEKF